MSASICKFKPRDNEEDYPMHLQAFMGGKIDGPSIQFTIGDKYACLSQEQLKTLVHLLQLRISGAINGGYEDYSFLIQRDGVIRNNSEGE